MYIICLISLERSVIILYGEECIRVADDINSCDHFDDNETWINLEGNK